MFCPVRCLIVVFSGFYLEYRSFFGEGGGEEGAGCFAYPLIVACALSWSVCSSSSCH